MSGVPPESAEAVARRLDLAPHPEGGFYRETYRHDAGSDPAGNPRRGAATAIYYLLPAGITSRWHRVDADEIWHWYAGQPLALALADAGGQPKRELLLGPDLAGGQEPQRLAPKNVWQSARSLGARGSWTLVGCTVAPAFRFEGFELAAEGWEP